MLKQKRGSIISTASVAGLTTASTPNNGPYGASKAGIIALTRHAAVAYAKDGIRINAIAPGLHNTKPLLLPPELGEKLEDMLRPFIPMERGASPEEIKGLAVYLASDASSYVTGQTFVQDGGLISWHGEDNLNVYSIMSISDCDRTKAEMEMSWIENKYRMKVKN